MEEYINQRKGFLYKLKLFLTMSTEEELESFDDTLFGEEETIDEEEDLNEKIENLKLSILIEVLDIVISTGLSLKSIESSAKIILYMVENRIPKNVFIPTVLILLSIGCAFRADYIIDDVKDDKSHLKELKLERDK